MATPREEMFQMGRKEYTLMKMQEYGFWPENLPTPYERQENESPEVFEKRNKIIEEQKALATQIAKFYEERSEIDKQLRSLRAKHAHTWDIERIRKDIKQTIMRESIKRRAERKKQKELERQEANAKRRKYMDENIIFVGKGYSSWLKNKETQLNKLDIYGLPIVHTDKELATLLGLEYKQLRFLAYHRDVVVTDHYYRFEVPKRSGGMRKIAAPNTLLKLAQRRILSEILEKVTVSDSAHGFIEGRSVLTGATPHIIKPELLINVDLENFFPSITFKRVRKMFNDLGYSGYISSILAILCTYCERIPIEVKGKVQYVKTSDRILPQGSPASPMITNIICRDLDTKMNELAKKYDFVYSRYADDMSFSFAKEPNNELLNSFMFDFNKLLYKEGLKANKEKTRYLRPNNRQCVTGIVVNNNEPGLPRNWVRKVRATLFNAKKLQAEGKLTCEVVYELSGMASWLKAVNPQRYSKLIDETKAFVASNRKL